MYHYVSIAATKLIGLQRQNHQFSYNITSRFIPHVRSVFYFFQEDERNFQKNNMHNFISEANEYFLEVVCFTRNKFICYVSKREKIRFVFSHKIE